MDAISLLKKDHANVKALFSQVEELSDRATASRKRLFDKVNAELRTHSEIEEQIFYPAVKQRAEDGEERDLVLESYEEHAIVATLLDQMQELAPDDETFAPKFNVLMELVRQHIKEEEKELFPGARDLFDRDEMERLGQELQTAKGGGKSSRGEIESPARRRAGAR